MDTDNYYETHTDATDNFGNQFGATNTDGTGSDATETDHTQSDTTEADENQRSAICVHHRDYTLCAVHVLSSSTLRIS